MRHKDESFFWGCTIRKIVVDTFNFRVSIEHFVAFQAAWLLKVCPLYNWNKGDEMTVKTGFLLLPAKLQPPSTCQIAGETHKSFARAMWKPTLLTIIKVGTRPYEANGKLFVVAYVHLLKSTQLHKFLPLSCRIILYHLKEMGLKWPFSPLVFGLLFCSE